MNSAVQRQMIIWTLLIVLALGAVSVLFLLQPPPHVSQHLPVPAKLKAQSRQPASTTNVQFNQEAMPDTDTAANAVDLALECAGTPKPTFRHNVRQVRLSGVVCANASKADAQKAKVRETMITNRSNNMVATVFFTSKDNFTTDYIPLVDGVNQITIAHALDNGTNEKQEIIVERKPANAEAPSP